MAACNGLGLRVTRCRPPTGVVTLLSDYEVCKEGDVLTPEQARVLVSLACNLGRGLLPFRSWAWPCADDSCSFSRPSSTSYRSYLGMRWLSSK